MPADDDTEPGRTSRYRLTLLKKLSQSTKAGEIRQRTNDLLDLKAMYDRLVNLLPALGLGREGVTLLCGQRHQVEDLPASSAIGPRSLSSRHRLHRPPALSPAGQLGGHAADYPAVAPERLPARAQGRCYARRHQRDDQLAGLLDTIDSSIVLVLRQIKQVVHDPTLTDAEKVGQVRHLLPADNDNEPAAMIALREELDAGRSDARLSRRSRTPLAQAAEPDRPDHQGLWFSRVSRRRPGCSPPSSTSRPRMARSVDRRRMISSSRQSAPLSCVTGRLPGSRSTRPSCSPISPGPSRPAR